MKNLLFIDNEVVSETEAVEAVTFVCTVGFVKEERCPFAPESVLP